MPYRIIDNETAETVIELEWSSKKKQLKDDKNMGLFLLQKMSA